MPPVPSKPKRKHVDRSIQDKLDILDEFHATGVSQVDICRKYDIYGSDKRKQIMLGAARKPHCFAKYHMTADKMPVDYYNTNKAWMDRKCFDLILTKWNRELMSKNRKILLVCDNASAHQCGKYSNIEVFYLLPNATSSIQPLDQGIILSTKRRYKKRLAERYLLAVDNGKDAVKMLRRLDLVQAAIMIAAAWNEVPVEIIKNCFRKARFQHHGLNPELQPEEPPVEPTPAVWLRIQRAIGEDVEFDEYVNAERAAVRPESETDAEILERVRAENQPVPDEEEESDMDDEDDDAEDNSKYAVKSTSQCLAMLECIKIYMRRLDIPVAMVESLESTLTNVHVKVCTKQVQVSDYFQKNTCTSVAASGRSSTPDSQSSSGRSSTPDSPSSSGRSSTPDSQSSSGRSSAVFTGTPVRSTPTRLRGRPGFTQFSPSTQLSLTLSGRSSTPDSPSTSAQSNSEFTSTPITPTTSGRPSTPVTPTTSGRPSTPVTPTTSGRPSTPVTSTPCSMRGRPGLTHLSLTPISSTPVSPATSGSLFSPASTTLTDSLNIDENLSVDTSAASLAAAQLMRDTPPAVSTKRRLIPEVDERPAKKMYKTDAAIDRLMNMTSDVSAMESDDDSVISTRL